MSDDFEKAVLRIASDWRSVQKGPSSYAGSGGAGACYLGVPPDEAAGRERFDAISNCSEFHFYLGSDEPELIQAFCDSAFAGKVAVLSIGNSSYAYNSGKGFDYSSITAILKESSLPQLRVLNLGVWELFHNAHAMYGRLGDITGLSVAMPRLERLGLYGHFELNGPETFERLERLETLMCDPVTGSVVEDAISNHSLNQLLESSFPMLRQASIDIEADEVLTYSLPESMTSGAFAPQIEKLDLCAQIDASSVTALRQGVLAKKLGKNLSLEAPE